MPARDQPLDGRRALVTGGATGIGRATVLRLAAAGAAVVADYVGDPAPAAEVVAEAQAAGGRVLAVEADVGSEEAVEGLFARARDDLGGPVDLLVNNAGVQAPFPLVEMPFEEWERVLRVNLTGPFLCARAAARGMIEAGSGGIVVNVTSVHEVIPWPSYSHYCASKGGLKLFSQSIARELAPHGIRVVQIAPGAIATPINQAMLVDPEAVEETEELIPWGRLGRPEEIAEAIAWVSGPGAEYVTGATLFVDGGMTLYPKFV